VCYFTLTKRHCAHERHVSSPLACRPYRIDWLRSSRVCKDKDWYNRISRLKMFRWRMRGTKNRRRIYSVFINTVRWGLAQQGKLQSFSTRAATSASYRPTKRPSDSSWSGSLANNLAAKRTNGAGRKVNAVSDRLGEKNCDEASRLLPRESAFY